MEANKMAAYQELSEARRQELSAHIRNTRNAIPDTTQSDVARAAGLSRQMIYYAETGKAKKQSIYITTMGALFLIGAARGIAVPPFPIASASGGAH